jgi:thiamine biosynthesis lipoprotein
MMPLSMAKQTSCLLTLIILTLCSGLSGCGGQHEKDNSIEHAVRDNLLGTVVSISIPGGAPESLFALCFEAIKDIDRRMSTTNADSEISLLCENAGNSFDISADVSDLLKRAVYFSDISGGAFDVSIGVITSLWKENGLFSVLPPDEEIQAKLPYIGYEHISFSDDGRAASIPQGMQIDLGSIAKGYACEVVKDILEANGVRHALLDLGGNIHVIGHKVDGSKWRVGVRDPMIGKNDYVLVVEVSDMSVVTSGGYERNFERDGVKYHHILDPKTGYPAESGLLSATIISHSSADADALSTACFVLGAEESMRIIESLDGVEGVFITAEQTIYATSGIMDALTITNPAYTLIESASGVLR